MRLGSPAPDFALKSLDGVNLRLSEFRSEVVVLNFWAPWCGKCRDAMPFLTSLQQQYQAENLHVLAVSVDGNTPKTLEFVAEENLQFPVLPDDERHTVSRLYETGKMPLTLVLDREGNVRHIHKGFKRNSGAEMAAQVAALLAE